MAAKPATMEKVVPRSQATLLQQKIDQLLPNDLHNLESPALYLAQMRARADIDARKFVAAFHPPARTLFREKVVAALVGDPDFRSQNQGELSQEQVRDLTNEQLFKVVRALGLSARQMREQSDFFLNAMMAAVLVSGSVATKVGVHFGLYCTSLAKLGTEKHLPFLDRAYELKELGCFAMTELGHGSNLQGLLTTATYLHSERAFVLNTPHETGMKYWIGNLAKFARFGAVFANLLVDGQNFGVHVFLVELRDARGDLRPGIAAGDVGAKLGINGADNGWCLFRRVRVPYDALLDRFSQITADGVFVSRLKKKSERFASQLAALSSGRLAVAATSVKCAYMTGGIALRYLSVRKQFGERRFAEQPLIGFPLVAKRLVPPLCEALLLDKMVERLHRAWTAADSSAIGDPAVKELHAACSMVKYLASHKGTELCLTARELAGGHGFSEHSRLPDMLKDQNVQVTWEGANDVLVQQAAKFLLSALRRLLTTGEVRTQSLGFLPGLADEAKVRGQLQAMEKLLAGLAEDQFDDESLLECVRRAHQLRLKSVGDCAAEYFAAELQKDAGLFRTFNKALPDHLVALSVCWAQLLCLDNFELVAGQFARGSSENLFLRRVLLVAAISSLRQSSFYLSGSLSVAAFNRLFELERAASAALVPNLLVYLDQELPPDEILNSTIGISTGEYFQAIVGKLYNSAELFGRAGSWDKLRTY